MMRTPSGLLSMTFLYAFLGAQATFAENLFHDLEAFPEGARVSFDRPADVTHFWLKGPERLVMDFHGAELRGATRRWRADGTRFAAVRVGRFGGDWTRVVFETPKSDFSTHWNGGTYSIDFEGKEPRLATEDLKDALAPVARPVFPVGAGAVKAAALPLKNAAIAGVRVGEEDYLILLDRKVRHAAFAMQSPARLVVELFDTLLKAPSAELEGRAGSPVLRVRMGQFKQRPEPVTRIVFDLERTSRYRAEWVDGGLRVRFLEEGDPSLLLDPFIGEPARTIGGELLDANGRGLDGTFLLTFSENREPGSWNEVWSEAVYVESRSGHFSADLGTIVELPTRVASGMSDIHAAPPPGTGWSVTLDRP